MDSLTPALRARVAAAEEEESGQSWRHAPPARRRRFRMLNRILQHRVLQTPDTLRPVALAHPFAHRPLVEFMMAIPPAQVCGPGHPRRLMRRAFSRFLPQAIVNRWSKAAYTRSYREALLPLTAELAANRQELRVVELGYVDRASLIERLTRFSQGLDCNDTQLRQIVLFEFWLRNRARAASPHLTLSSAR
jgi:hypothetical protein